MTRKNTRKTLGRGREIPLHFLSPQAWLQQYISKHGPSVKIETVLKYGCIAGFSAAELHRAAATLAVICYGEPGESARYWRLRSTESNEMTGPH